MPAADASVVPPRGPLTSLKQRAAHLLRGRRGDTVWALFDSGTGLLASVFSFLLLGRNLGAAGYGAFIGLYALIGPFLALSQAGIFLAAMEHVAREGEDPREVARSFVSMTAVSTLFWVPALAAVSLRSIEGLPPYAAILMILTEFCLNGIFATSQAMVQVVTGFPAASRLRMSGALSKIGLLTVLAAGGSLTLTTFAVGQAATIGAVVVFAAVKVSRLVGAPILPGRIGRRHVRSALLYGLGISASMAQTDGDKFVLNAAHHQGDAGRYGAAYRVMQVALLPASALSSAMHLSFLDGTASANAQLRRAIRLALITLAYAIPAVVGLVLAAPFVPRILTKDFEETAFILQLLSPVVILRAVQVYPMNGLMGLGRNGLRTTILGANALLSLILYAALIPKYSWHGALAATLVSEVSLCASAWIALFLYERSTRPTKTAVQANASYRETPDVGR